MLFIALLALVVQAVVAFPAAMAPANATISKADVYPAYVCSESYMRGVCGRVYADKQCVNLPDELNGKVSSMFQFTAYLCDYYSDADCQFNHARVHGDFKSATINGVAIQWFNEMGPFDDKMKSVSCEAYVNMPGDTTSTPSDHETRGIDSYLQAPGSVSVFSEPNFAGAETPVDALDKCSQPFGAGAIKSLKQQQGTVCHYYQSTSCTISNHVPVLRHDSKDAAWDAAELGEWSGKVQSFKCETAVA